MSQALAQPLIEHRDAIARVCCDLLTNQPIRNPFLRKAVEASRRDFYVRALAEAS